MELFEKYKTLFNKYEVNTPLRISHFMAQIEHESGLKLIRESLYYTSIERLRKIFITPFKNKSDEFVSKYLKNSEKLANYVYAGRMGNGDEKSGDGYKYRGAGYIQVTGKSMYKLLTDNTKIDFINNPDLMLVEANAITAALEFWKINKLNLLADKDDVNGITKKINGGYNGLEDRKKLLNKYKKKWEK